MDKTEHEYRELLSDLLELRDKHVAKSKAERDQAEQCGVGGFAVNAAWAAARQEFADDLFRVTWNLPAPTDRSA